MNMSRYEQEILRDIRKRLEISDRKKWKTLTDKQKELVVQTYYQIRDTDYQNINFLLREHAGERRQFAFLMLGIGIGIFANPISSILVKYFPAETWIDDLRTSVFFALLILWSMFLFTRMSAQSLGDENILERLLEVGEQRAPRNSESDPKPS